MIDLLILLTNILHISIILFVLIVPFTDIPGLLTLNISLTLSLISHWLFNNNTCCLTLFESYITGAESSETFIHKIISPIYDINEYTLNNMMWILTIFSMIFSIYKLYIYFQNTEFTFKKLFLLK